MFTGLVQALGTIDTIDGQSLRLSWSRGGLQTAAFADVALGDSIAVDGICLTVTQIFPRGFTAAVSPETMARTSLGHLTPQSIVNLEPSLRVGSKLGGHFVTGHIDGVGHLHSVTRSANAWELTIDVPDAIARYIVEKGSVAVNGISLTVASCSPGGNRFTVAVIPLTYSETNLQFLQSGSPVNIEADVLGKYVERFLAPRLGGREGDPALPLASSDRYEDAMSALTPDFLAEHGYI
ncbi:MAG: riboflavin synthase [Cyanobacteria bacterium P01_A01_bin.135]